MKISANVDDEKLEEFLDEQDNKSETLREALRLYRLREGSVEDERLTDKQQAAYAWMRENVGLRKTMQYEVVQTVLAQKLSLSKEIVKELVLKPLDRHGYLRVRPRMHHVDVTVLPPDVVDVPESRQPLDDVEDVEERMDALAEAGEEVSQSAD